MSEQFLEPAIMHTQEPLTVSLEPDPLGCWAGESTASALRALAVRLQASGLSLRETVAALEMFGVTRSHQAVVRGLTGLQKRLQTRRRSRELCSRAAYQNVSRSKDGEAAGGRRR